MYILNYLIKSSQSWMFAFNSALINALMLIDQVLFSLDDLLSGCCWSRFNK